MICGDMDSIRTEVERYYYSKAVLVIKDTDKYSTDLTKCMFYSRKQLEEERRLEEGPLDVVIFGSLSGRADQAFSQLHLLYTLFRHNPLSWTGDIYLTTPESLVFVLHQGSNKIHTPVSARAFTENVGIIPIGKPAFITTRGFEWDVLNWYTEFGGNMSTSNHIKADVVEVDCSEPVLFTLEYA